MDKGWRFDAIFTRIDAVSIKNRVSYIGNSRNSVLRPFADELGDPEI